MRARGELRAGRKWNANLRSWSTMVSIETAQGKKCKKILNPRRRRNISKIINRDEWQLHDLMWEALVIIQYSFAGSVFVEARCENS